jgi:hypothetical protein
LERESVPNSVERAVNSNRTLEPYEQGNNMNKNISVVTLLAFASVLAACGGSTPPAEEPAAAVAEDRAAKANDATEANTDRADKAADKAEESAAASDKSADKAEKSADDAKK